MNNFIEKPVKRNPLRRKIGREYYIMKRKAQWLVSDKKYVKSPVGTEPGLENIIMRHSTPMLRPLKNVEMYLQHNKVINLRLAIAKINGVTICPGESFSLWKLVGRPSAGKGYLEGLVISNGEISKGVGGGLCQLGNLLYWMILHTELDITERHRHTFDVFPDVNRKIPFACGATLGYNYLDLGVQNNTEITYRIHLWQENDNLCGEITADTAPLYMYEIVETDHTICPQWWGRYTRHNRIWKKKILIANGKEEMELISENHAIMMYNPLLPD